MTPRGSRYGQMPGRLPPGAPACPAPRTASACRAHDADRWGHAAAGLIRAAPRSPARTWTRGAS